MYHYRTINLSGIRISEIGNAAGDRATKETRSAVCKHDHIVRVITKVGEEAISSLLGKLSSMGEGKFECGNGR